MRAELGTSALWAGLLTTLPGLCFAAAGLTAGGFDGRAKTAEGVPPGTEG